MESGALRLLGLHHSRRKTPTFSNLAGAGYQSRTDDLLITNQLLYQLSYAGNGGIIASPATPAVRG